jgi:dihydropteroate synthase
VDENHFFIAQMFEEKMNSLLKSTKESHPSKKRSNPSRRSISKFLSIKNMFFKKDVSQKEFLKDPGLILIKNNLLIQFVESMWLKHLILCLCLKLHFPSKRKFSQDILLGLMEKKNELYFVPSFEATETTWKTLAKSLIELLDKYGLRKKIIAYVKDERFNLNAMTSALKYAINYEYLRLEESF